jgi:hypothetical protein
MCYDYAMNGYPDYGSGIGIGANGQYLTWQGAGMANANLPPREVKLRAAKAWLKERGGAHPGVLERFANRKGPMA